MPRTRRLLNSSPLQIPSSSNVPATASKPRPQRRVAALAALPTPPRTHSKRKRTSPASKPSRATDSDDGELLTLPTIKEEDPGSSQQVDDNDNDQADHRTVEGAIFVGNKKRKTLDALVAELSEQTAEDDFWLGPSTSSAKPTASRHRGQTSSTRSRQRSITPMRSPSSSPPAALLRRKNQQKSNGLISPPPSRHRAHVSSEPVTPPPRRSLRTSLFRQLPERDSPNNPFLVESTPDDEPDSSPPQPITPLQHVEKPTLTYVLCVFISLIVINIS